jgi:hypothetical protein
MRAREEEDVIELDLIGCERRKSRAAVLSQAGAPLSWTSERSE